MTKKDYIAFAQMLSDTSLNVAGVNPTSNGLLRHLAIEMADLFERDNPRFDRETFMKAAGF